MQAILGVVFMASPDYTGEAPRTHLMQYPGGINHRTSHTAATKLRPEIKLEAFYACSFASNIKLESAYLSLSLAFDSCAFIAIVASAYRFQRHSLVGALRFTGIIGTVVQDATIYFVVIFTSHLTLTMFAFFVRVIVASSRLGYTIFSYLLEFPMNRIA